MITDADVIDAVPADGKPIGIRELAAAVGTTVRKVGSQVERLASQGLLIVERPGTGALGERLIRRDGATEANALRVKLAHVEAQRDALSTAAQQAVALLTQALGSHR